MSSLNQVTLIGSLGKDPEIRYSGAGTAICTLSMATSRRWKDKSTGQKKEETDWHRVSLFGKTAEIAGEYLQKGSLICIVGRIQTRSYEKNGQTLYITEVIGNELQMLARTKGAGGGGSTTQQQDRSTSGGPANFDDMEDDIPY